jgi:hypothetical protein
MAAPCTRRFQRLARVPFLPSRQPEPGSFRAKQALFGWRSSPGANGVRVAAAHGLGRQAALRDRPSGLTTEEVQTQPLGNRLEVKCRCGYQATNLSTAA